MNKIFIIIVLLITRLCYADELDMVKDELGNIERVATKPFVINEQLLGGYVYINERPDILFYLQIDIENNFPVERIHTVEAIPYEGEPVIGVFSYERGWLSCMFNSTLLIHRVILKLDGGISKEIKIPVIGIMPYLNSLSIIKEYVEKE